MSLPKLSPLSPESWSFSLDWLPGNAYLVGGAVRDALIGRQGEYLDLDFVLPEQAVETARRIARHYRAGFVVLDRERQIARVVFAQQTVDFALQEGSNLETDLRRRDFTINAIAYSPHQQKLIDPLGGLVDLRAKILKMVSASNLEDDPLRLLRAYRQAAQLDFAIEPATRAAIKSLAPQLGKVAAERVQTELGHLLVNSLGSQWLKQAWEDRLLQPWFRQATAETLQQVAAVDESAHLLGQTWPQFIGHSEWIMLAKLACLVPRTLKAAEEELISLKYSRAQIRTVIAALKHLPQLLGQAVPMSLGQQYFFFLNLGEVFPVLALLAAAVGVKFTVISPLVGRYFEPLDPVAHPQSLVTGNDLIEELSLLPGPKIGKLLAQIQLAQIEGKITTRREALDLAVALLQQD